MNPQLEDEIAPDEWALGPRWRRLSPVLVVAIILGTLGLDQLVKRLAVALLPAGERISLLGDLVRLELVRNPGAFLSFGAGWASGARSALFTWGVAGLILVAGGAALSRRMSTRQAAGAALVAGGGLGNLFDRIFSSGCVIDFLNLGLGTLRTGIFNLADVALVVGIVFLAWVEPPPPDARRLPPGTE